MRSGIAAVSRVTSERPFDLGLPALATERRDLHPHDERRGDLGACTAIFAPKANQFGIGHQIDVVRSGPHQGRLVDVFMLFHGSGANKKGQEIAVIVSDDRGVTWSDPITVSKRCPGS